MSTVFLFFFEKDGHSGAFVKNAAKLGRDLSALELVALSHGHYDHTGGFLRLLDTARSFELCLKECIFHKKYVHEGRTPLTSSFCRNRGFRLSPDEGGLYRAAAGP